MKNQDSDKNETEKFFKETIHYYQVYTRALIQALPIMKQAALESHLRKLVAEMEDFVKFGL